MLLDSRRKRHPSVVVVNPGTHPEPAQLAQALVADGREVHYVTTASFASDSFLVRASTSRPARHLPLVSEVRRRVLPAGLFERHVKRIGLLDEALFQLLRKAGSRRARFVLARRNRRFSTRVARYLRSQPDLKMVIAQQTAALQPFMAADSRAVRVLLYPIAHHSWMRRTLSEEAHQNPRWARFLQGHDRTPAEMKALDREVHLADVVLVASSFVKSTFVSEGVAPSKIRVVPLGAQAPTDLPPRDAGEGEGLKMLFVGQVNQRKGIGYLLEAMAALPNLEISLTVVGHYEASIRSELSKDPRVSVLGVKSRTDLAEIYQSHDLLMLPSLAEGFGLVALEAMGYGTAAVVSECTFADDIITPGENGLVVRARHTQDLIDVIRFAAERRAQIIEMGRSARQRAMEFGWEQYRDQAVAVLDGHEQKYRIRRANTEIRGKER